MKPASASEVRRSTARSDILAGIIGGLLGYTASNAWFFFLAPAIIADLPRGGFMPEPFSFLLIDMFIGGAAGYAAALTSHNFARLQDASPPRPIWLQIYALTLGVGLSLLANMILVFMMGL